MRQLLVLLFLAVACVAQERCCVPELHTIREARTSSFEENGKTLTDVELSERAYDFTEERFGHDGEIRYANGSSERFKVIELIREGARYFIQDEKCTKEKPRETRVDRCVSETANYTGSFYIGDHQMDCDQWAENISTADAEGFSSVTLTRGNCVPVSDVFSGTVKKTGQQSRRELTVRTFSDFRKGVEDPDRWFTPPSFCP